MKIAIWGSTGFVGKVLLKKALEKGFQVKTLVRNSEKLGILRKELNLFRGMFSKLTNLKKQLVDRK